MSRRRKTCRCCRQLLRPHPQTYRQQITCDQADCRRWRLGQKWAVWRRKNPLYGQSRRGKQKRWRQEKGAAYMRRYRASHAAYVKRNRLLQRERNRRNRGMIVKPTEWGAVCREKMNQNRTLRLIVKPTEWSELVFWEIDEVWRFLKGRSLIVKPTDMDRRG